MFLLIICLGPWLLQNPGDACEMSFFQQPPGGIRAVSAGQPWMTSFSLAHTDIYWARAATGNEIALLLYFQNKKLFLLKPSI